MYDVLAITADNIISDTAGASVSCIINPFLTTIALFLGVILGVNLFIFRKRFYKLLKNIYFWVIVVFVVVLAIAHSAFAATPIDSGLSYDEYESSLPNLYYSCPTGWEEVVEAWPKYLLHIAIVAVITFGLLQIIYFVVRLFTKRPGTNQPLEVWHYSEASQTSQNEEIGTNSEHDKPPQ